MAFINEIFPNPKLIHGLQRTTSRPVKVLSNGNTEYRIRKNAFERYEWEYPSSTILPEDLIAISEFYALSDGGLKSFKYQDPRLPDFNGTILTRKEAGKYYLRTNTGHRIWHISSGMYCTINDEPTHYPVVLGYIDNTREPYLQMGGEVTDVVKLYGACYYTARFDGEIQDTIEALDYNNLPIGYNYGSIKLVEVFETSLSQDII